jgi:hypothetical protein
MGLMIIALKPLLYLCRQINTANRQKRIERMASTASCCSCNRTCGKISGTGESTILKEGRFQPYTLTPLPPSLTLMPYERQTRIEDARGKCRFVRGTPFPDQAVNYLQLALKRNQDILQPLAIRIAREPNLQINLPASYITKEITDPYLKQFRFLLKHGISGTQQTWSLVCTYFLQIGQLYWMALHRELEREYSSSDYLNAINLPIMDDMPRKPLQQFTQMDCVRALGELTYVIKHLPHSQSMAKLISMVIVHACRYLMGSGGPRMFDGHANNNRMALPMNTDINSDKERYVASGRYVLHTAVRTFYLFRNMRLSTLLPSREMTGPEINFLLDHGLTDKVRTIVRTSMSQNKEVIEQEKLSALFDSRLSLGDKELNTIEFAGQELVNDIIRNMRGDKAGQILERMNDYTKLDDDTILGGIAGIDIAEQLAVRVFMSYVSGKDLHVALQDGFVITNAAVDTYFSSAKLMDSSEPLIVQLDARYHLVYRRCQIQTRDIYETLAAWLSLIYIYQQGIPERSVGCLYNTYRELCGPKIKLPATTLYVD